MMNGLDSGGSAIIRRYVPVWNAVSTLSREVAEYLKSLPPRQSITMNREYSLHTKSEILSSISRFSKTKRHL